MTSHDWFTRSSDFGHAKLSDPSGALPDEQFNEKTARMALLLAERFPDRGSHIGLWGENSLDYLTALFAVLRAGHVAVPLQTRLSARELADTVRSAELHGILAARTIPQTHRDALTGVPFYALTQRIDGEPPRVRPRELAEKDIAVLLCSSGSSGKVKVIPFTLRALLDHAKAVCEHLKVTWHDSWLVCLPFYHIGGLSIAFRCLVSGASLTIAQSADPDEINKFIDHEEISVISVVPTVLERMLAKREWAPFPESLRAIIVGGGPVPAGLLARCPRAYATYGLTETGSMTTCARPGCGEQERKTCGPPLPDMQTKILNDDGKEVRRGEAGEIVVRGPGTAQAYWRDANASAKTFRSGWIYTGDIGRLDDNGFLTVEARRTDLVVTGGENVSPAEIEDILRQYARIADVVVLPVNDREWGQTPAALVALTPGRPLKKIHFYNFLEGKLARFKFPRKIVIVEKIPRLGNGKPDLKQVRKMLQDGQDTPA
jgi:o-succinylbenzoate---CoA ligase